MCGRPMLKAIKIQLYAFLCIISHLHSRNVYIYTAHAHNNEFG